MMYYWSCINKIMSKNKIIEDYVVMLLKSGLFSHQMWKREGGIVIRFSKGASHRNRHKK